MKEYSEVFVGIDTAKVRNAVAIAEGDRRGEVRYVGEFDTSPEATRRLIARLSKKYDRVHFCYEAGPTGYGLYRTIVGSGHSCSVVAPSLIPRRPGDRVKTNRRDAQSLARLLRAGELVRVWVPDEKHEAIRDLSRARDAAVRDVRAKRQQVGSFLLRQGRIFAGKTAWGLRHRRWLAEQRFAEPAQLLVLQDAVEAVHCAEARLARLDEAIEELVPSWSMAPVVAALQAMRGVSFVSAVAFLVEVGDLRRFETPRQLMGYLGLVPTERSTGEKVWRGGITKAGNIRARRMLIEGAWSYRLPARVGVKKQAQLEGLPQRVREIAWKAQTRLCRRYRMMMARGKRTTVAVTAVAREMSGFLWAIAREVAPAAPC
jgi:transposase